MPKVVYKFRRFFMFLLVLVFVFSSQATLLSALSRNDAENLNTPFYDSNSCATSSDTSTPPSSASPTSSGQTVIVIDPGHSGTSIINTDPQTGLKDFDYPNTPEISEVFAVAQKVQTKLAADGYKVIMTKTSANQSVSFRERANIANQANAALALSIHNDHGPAWSAFAQVYTQNVGDYRQNKPGMGSGTQKVKFTDASVAQKSNSYGAIFAQERTKDEHHTVTVDHVSFDSRADIASGNLPMVQLFSKVPWVYNEVGAKNNLSQSQINQYAQGLIDGVEKSVPASGAPGGAPSQTPSQSGSTSCCSGDTGAGGTLSGSDNQAKIFNYFTGKGLSAIQAAGIAGNFQGESGSNPSSPGGYLAQWGGGRLTNLQAFAQEKNIPVTDLGVQLDFVWWEFTGSGAHGGGGYSTVLQHIKAATTVEDAVNQFLGPNDTAGHPVSVTDSAQRSGGYENPSIPRGQKRLDAANEVLHRPGGASSGSSSSGCSDTVVCNGASGSATGLSQTRQNVVCVAQQELASWKAKPGYPSSSLEGGSSKYTQNHTEAWCADFASWVYKEAGYPLQSGTWRVPGVSSVQTIGEANGHFHWHKASSGYTPKPGDLAIHGGSHVNIFISSSGGTSHWIGGNQSDVVSEWTGNSYYNDGETITGYVSPD